MKGLNDWLDTHPNESATGLRKLWDVTSPYKQGYVVDVDKDHYVFMEMIGRSEQPEAKVVPMKKRSMLLQIAAAVIVFAFVTFVVDKFFSTENVMNRVTTSNLEQKDFSLADGTIVNINSNSQLDFPTVFDSHQRNVKLSGEAFFDVARNESKPFIIETEKASIEVLGTSFNVRSFPDENRIEVFVQTGSVKVNLKDKEEAHVLSPGELFVYRFDEKTIEKTKANPANVNAWKSGKLIFKNRPMEEILSALEKQHSVTIIANNESLNNCPFTISLNSLDLQEAFKGLEVACDLAFSKKDDRKYEVNGSCCD